MSRLMSGVVLAAAVVLLTAVASPAQQTTSSSATKTFEVLAVDVVLDVRAQQAIESRAGTEQVLKLVKDHKRRLPILRVELERQVEQLRRGGESRIL